MHLITLNYLGCSSRKIIFICILIFLELIYSTYQPLRCGRKLSVCLNASSLDTKKYGPPKSDNEMNTCSVLHKRIWAVDDFEFFVLLLSFTYCYFFNELSSKVKFMKRVLKSFSYFRYSWKNGESIVQFDLLNSGKKNARLVDNGMIIT